MLSSITNVVMRGAIIEIIKAEDLPSDENVDAAEITYNESSLLKRCDTLKLMDFDDVINIDSITTEYPKFKREIYVNDDNEIICQITGLKLGIPINKSDINGNMIFSNDLIYDIYSHDPTAVVDVNVFDGELSYGLNNYHCGHCPSFEGVVVIGVNDKSGNVALYKDNIKDCEMVKVGPDE